MMPLDDDQIKELALSLLKAKTKRDKQSKIGPSGIGNPCDYCLAMALLGGGQYRESPWWLGARMGTAMHGLLEHEANKHIHTPELPEFNALKDANTETRLFVYHLDGYGSIYGSSDLRLTTDNLIDWKSSTKDKIKRYKLDGVPQQYVIQQMLYAYAWNIIEPGAVERCSLVFVARDGSGDNDVWVCSFDYDSQVALDALNRLRVMWEWLQSGGDPDTLESHAECFTCQNILRRW
jgi:hypothetical protein